MIGCPVALRASSRMKTARSAARGISFSIPMQAMCSLGSEMPRSAFPSFVQTTNPPVSATAKFTPVMPASAAMNLSAQVRASGFGQVVRVRRSLLGPQVLVKRLAHFLLLDVNRRQARCGWAARSAVARSARPGRCRPPRSRAVRETDSGGTPRSASTCS